jgi:hypothetical protein
MRHGAQKSAPNYSTRIDPRPQRRFGGAGDVTRRPHLPWQKSNKNNQNSPSCGRMLPRLLTSVFGWIYKESGRQSFAVPALSVVNLFQSMTGDYL